MPVEKNTPACTLLSVYQVTATGNFLPAVLYSFRESHSTPNLPVTEAFLPLFH